MKRLALLLISLISFMFGCSGKKTPATKQAAWPQFPESDNPSVRIEAVLPDSLSVLNAFYIPSDKKQVYVLVCQQPPRKNPDANFNVPAIVDFKLLCLDEKGKILHQMKLPDSDARYGADFGMLDGRIFIRLSDCFLGLDTAKLTITEKIPIWFDQRFPSKDKVELMMPHEQRAAYRAAFEKAIKSARSCQFLDWTPSGEGYALIGDASGKRAAWSPQQFVDNHVEELKKLYPNLRVTLYAGYQYDAAKDLQQIADEQAHIQELEYLPGGSQLVYPNYKERRILQHEMTVAGKQLRFSTTDRNGHDLRLVFSDNKMLSTWDGAAWVQYEGVLYRVD